MVLSFRGYPTIQQDLPDCLPGDVLARFEAEREKAMLHS
jgi:hypothetical protein